MKTILVILLSLLFVGANCTPTPNPMPCMESKPPSCPDSGVHDAAPIVTDAGPVVIVDATTPPPPPQEAAPAPDPTGCAAACANIAKLGCPEGNTSCVSACAHTQDSGVTDLKPACLAAAKTVADLQKCGTVKCAIPTK